MREERPPTEHFCEDPQEWVVGSPTTCETCGARLERIREEKRNENPFWNLRPLLQMNKLGQTENEFKQEIYAKARRDGRDISRAR